VNGIDHPATITGTTKIRPRCAATAMSTETIPPPVEKPKENTGAEEKIKDAFEKNWNVIVWNDPINLMSYVVHVFMRVLGFNREKATKHMMEVHEQGRSLVATETRERAEFYHQQIQSFGLNVTIEQSS
jgi:ATP-dependent Clp protease adaptor protein ClpS